MRRAKTGCRIDAAAVSRVTNEQTFPPRRNERRGEERRGEARKAGGGVEAKERRIGGGDVGGRGHKRRRFLATSATTKKHELTPDVPLCVTDVRNRRLGT